VGKDDGGRVLVLLPTRRGADLAAGIGGGGDPMTVGPIQRRSRPPFPFVDCSRHLASRFIFSVLLGSLVVLPSAASEVEVTIRCAVIHSDVVGSVALGMLMHPKASAPPLSRLRQADLDLGPLAMQSGGGGGGVVLVPLRWPPLSSLPPDLVGWHGGAALHTSTSMLKLRSPAMDLSCRLIIIPQPGSNGGDTGELWCLCIRSWSGGRGSLSLPPLFVNRWASSSAFPVVMATNFSDRRLFGSW
jgi:hypothetical protein